jgi:hypothetical protein
MEDYLRDDVRRSDRAAWQLLVLLSRHRIKTKLLFRDGTSSRGRPRQPEALFSSVQKGRAQCCTLNEIVREITPT